MSKTISSRTTALLAVLSTAFSCACSSDDSPNDDEGDDNGEAKSPAVVVVGQVYAPEDYLTYVRVFPEVPEGDVDFSEFHEFGNANVNVFGGRIFVSQDGTTQRFSVSDELELLPGPRFSWADFGIPPANATSTVFISETRAYTFAPGLGIIVVWDPEEMVRTNIIEVDFPERAEGMDTWANDGRVVGDKVIWSLFSGDWVKPEPYPAVVLAIADKDSDDPPTFIEDTRCLPGGPSFVDEKGDYYVHGAAYFGYFYAYGGIDDGRTCALRVKAGETEIDPDFEIDYQEVTGSYVNTPWINVTGDQFVSRVWDDQVALPEVPDDFWAGEGLSWKLIDQSSGETEPYPELEGLLDIDGTTRIVDGVSYFQVSETGYVEGGNTDVVELHPDGVREKFTLTGGFLLGLERLR